MTYNTLDFGTAVRLRGTNQQTTTGLMPSPWPSYRVGGDTVRLEGCSLGYVALQNRSGSAGVVGFGGRLPNRLWRAGFWSQDNGYTDDTVDAQDTGASDFAMEALGAANSGFVVISPVKFNAISINVGTASVGGGAVRDVAHTNADGSDWTTLSNLFIQDGASSQYAAGENLIVFPEPAQWGQVQAGGLSGIPAGYYALRVRSTTVPVTTAGQATAIEVWNLSVLTEAVADNGVYEWAPTKGEARFPYADGFGVLFETASPGNRVTAHWRTGA